MKIKSMSTPEERKQYIERYYNKNRERIRASRNNWVWRKRWEFSLWNIKQALEPINRALKNVKKPTELK